MSVTPAGVPEASPSEKHSLGCRRLFPASACVLGRLQEEWKETRGANRVPVLIPGGRGTRKHPCDKEGGYKLETQSLSWGIEAAFLHTMWKTSVFLTLFMNRSTGETQVCPVSPVPQDISFSKKHSLSKFTCLWDEQSSFIDCRCFCPWGACTQE